MLPVSTLDPIKIKLDNFDHSQSSTLSLYPITVEFDRLIRRQKQLKIQNSNKSECLNEHNNKLWPAALSIFGQSYNVDQLLYATIVHYHSTLSSTTMKLANDNSLKPKWKNKEIDTLSYIHQTLCNSGTKTILFLVDKKEICQHLFDDANKEQEEKLANTNFDETKKLNDSSDWNTSISDDCPIKNTSDNNTGRVDSDNSSFKSNQIEQTRTFKINSIVNRRIKHSNNYSKPSFERNNKQKSKSSKLSTFLQHFDHFIDEALERKKQFLLWCNNVKHNPNDSMNDIETDLIGIEQQIIGAISFYKNYRLDCVKLIEIPFMAVHKNYQRLTIGTKLLQCLKEFSQIGPYDALHVQFPANQEELLIFFIKNDFTDDLILNAGFELLTINDFDDDCCPNDDDEESNHHKIQNIFQIRKRINKEPTISMCYLPPFSVGTLSESLNSQGYCALNKWDDKFIDDIMEQANRIWRRDLLSAYRTQWSCVSRLRQEIIRLRKELSKRDLSILQLRKENIQLHNTLIQRNHQASSNDFSSNKDSTKHYKIPFELLDF